MSAIGAPALRDLSHDELTDMVASALRADLLLSAEPEPPGIGELHAPMLVLVGDADPAVPVTATHAWAARTSGATTHRVLHGDHDALRRDTTWLPDLIDLARPDGIRPPTGRRHR